MRPGQQYVALAEVYAPSCASYLPIYTTQDLLKETWNNIPGENISDLTDNISNTPDEIGLIDNIDLEDSGSNFGDRVTGYIYIPPTKGRDYGFKLKSEHRIQLSLNGETNTTPSAPNYYSPDGINLASDTYYPIEVLKKQGLETVPAIDSYIKWWINSEGGYVDISSSYLSTSDKNYQTGFVGKFASGLIDTDASGQFSIPFDHIDDIDDMGLVFTTEDASFQEGEYIRFGHNSATMKFSIISV